MFNSNAFTNCKKFAVSIKTVSDVSLNQIYFTGSTANNIMTVQATKVRIMILSATMNSVPLSTNADDVSPMFDF